MTEAVEICQPIIKCPFSLQVNAVSGSWPVDQGLGGCHDLGVSGVGDMGDGSERAMCT